MDMLRTKQQRYSAVILASLFACASAFVYFVFNKTFVAHAIGTSSSVAQADHISCEAPFVEEAVENERPELFVSCVGFLE